MRRKVLNDFVITYNIFLKKWLTDKRSSGMMLILRQHSHLVTASSIF